MTNKKVVTLTGDEYVDEVVDGEPNQYVVDLAGTILALAESGDVQGMLLVTQDSMDMCQGYVVGNTKLYPFPLLGVVELVKADLMHGWRYGYTGEDDDE